MRPSLRTLRSLRYRTLMVVIGVAALPLIWVWASGWFEASVVLAERWALHRAASNATSSYEAGEDLRSVARRHLVRLRVLDPQGQVVLDIDATVRVTWFDEVADPIFGPDGPPDLRAYDDGLPPLASREEVREAGLLASARCEVVRGGQLLVCAAAQRAADGSTIHVLQGSRRLVRSLYEERFLLLVMSCVVALVGGGLAVWVGWRLVRPIEQLRDQVRARAGGLSTEPVRLDRADELGDLARSFNELLEAVARRDEANAAFAADMAHELKNPVAAVRAAAEALAGDRPVEGSRKERLARVLADSSRRMELVVDRFLELARAEAGLIGVARAVVPLRDVVDSLVEAMRGDPRFEGISFDVEGVRVSVWGVPERLETALRNLLINAAGYASRRVWVVVSQGEGRVRVEVMDDGPGLTPDAANRAFDRYYTTRDGGTGLGLPLVKAIVEAHGGAVRVGVAPGGGARFVVDLLRQEPRYDGAR